MMIRKTLLTLICSLFVGFASFGQQHNAVSIINLLEGEWVLTSTVGGFCGCEIDVQNSSDSQNVLFEKHPNAKDSVRYSFYSDNKLVSGHSKINYTDPNDGTSIFGKSGWYLENWNEPFLGEIKRYFRVNDSSLVIDPDERIADLPSNKYRRKTSVEIFISNCEGRYTYQYATPQPSDSVKWELASGQASFTYRNNFLSITESEDSTVMLMKVYNKGYVSTTSYLYTLPEDCERKEVRNDTIIINNCDFPYVHQYAMIQVVGLEEVWELESGNADFDFNESQSDLLIKDADHGAILLHKVFFDGDTTITRYFLQIIGNCENENFIIEGKVQVENNTWDYGIVFLYNKEEGKAVDSVVINNGSYKFTKVLAGTYTFCAVPYTDNELTTKAKDYVTTYYVNKLNLGQANTIQVTDNTYDVDFNLRASSTTSVNGVNNFEVSAYPNPFTNSLMINTDQNGVEVTVVNVQGMTIHNDVLNQSTRLNTSLWAEGVYFIQVQTQNGIKTLTVVK